MATNVTTLKNAEKTDDLLPRTELKAVFDSDGNYLDSGLKASDLNALKGGVVDELVRFTEAEAGTPVPTDADTLEGHPASYFATASEVSSLSTVETINLSSYISDPDITVNKVLAYKCGRIISLTIDCVIANTNRHDISIPKTILPSPKASYSAMTTVDWQNDSVVSQYGAIGEYNSSNTRIMLRASSANLKILASVTYIF